VRGPEGSYRVIPAGVSVRVMGPENLVGKLSRESLQAQVGVRQVLNAATELPVTVRLPDQVVRRQRRDAGAGGPVRSALGRDRLSGRRPVRHQSQ